MTVKRVDAYCTANTRVNLTFFTSGSWLSIHAISMQGIFINFCKSSKSWAAAPNKSQADTTGGLLRTDSDTSFDYPVWPMWLCLCELWMPWPTCFTAWRHRRRRRLGPIRGGNLLQAPILPGERVCLVVCVLCCFPHGHQQRCSGRVNSCGLKFRYLFFLTVLTLYVLLCCDLIRQRERDQLLYLYILYIFYVYIS